MTTPEEKLTEVNKGFEDPTFVPVQKPGKGLNNTAISPKTSGTKVSVTPPQVTKTSQVNNDPKKP